jgi:hypothetical protein
MWAHEAMNLPRPKWLIEGILPQQAFAMLVGPYENAKSFAALAMGMCITNGVDFYDRPVQRGLCAFVLGEGLNDFPDRIEAFRRHYDLPPQQPFMIFEAPTMFMDRAAVDLLIADIQEGAKELGLPVALVVIDTVARATPGVDENAAGPMGVFVSHCDRVKTTLGCTLLAVHHTGKDATKGARGSTALPAAADTIIGASRNAVKGKHDILTISIEKQKGAAKSPDMLFDLVIMPARDKETSLVPVLRTEPVKARGDKVDIKGKDRTQFDCLVEVISETGEGSATRDDWFEQCVRKGLYDASNDEQKKKDLHGFRTRVSHLGVAGWIEIRDDRVILLRGPNGEVTCRPQSEGNAQ